MLVADHLPYLNFNLIFKACSCIAANSPSQCDHQHFLEKHIFQIKMVTSETLLNC